MTTAYTPILKLALPVTGELDGTWGDVVNNNITSMVEQAVAGLATINTWTTNSHTLTTANGTTSESRCAMLVIDDDGAGNPSAAATVICPTATKSYIVRNLCGQTVTVKTSAGTGVAVPNNQAALVFCDGTNVVTGAFNGDVVGPATATNNAIVTFDGTTGKLIKDNSGATISAGVITATGFAGPLNGTVGATTPATGAFTTASATTGNITTVNATTVNATTVDTTNIEVTNLKAKDGTAAGSIADITGVVTITTLAATTGNITTVNATTVDTTNIEVTNLKAKDGTAAGSIADVTGVVTLTTLASTTGNITTVNSTTVDTTNIEVTNLKAKDGTSAGSIADSTGVVTLASSVLTTSDINGGTIDNTAIGASTPSTVVATQVDIVAQGDLRFQDTTGGEYVALQAPGTLASSYTLTLPVDDGTSGQSLITDGSGVLSWSTSASGDVYGPASSTDNALVRFDSTTGKLIQNGIVRQDDNGNLQNINAFIFSTSPTTIGTTRGGMFWDTANQTIQAIISDDDLTVPIGQKNLVRVYASENISEGQVVSITGVQSERPSAVRADNSTAALSVGALGIAVRNIPLGTVGYVCTFGIVSPLDTSSLTVGLPVYVSSTAGLLTQTAPVAPAYSVAIGWVVKSDALTGSIFVNINKGVSNVGGTGTVNGLTLTGSVTSTGNLTLGGTLSGVSLTTQVSGTLPVANGGTGVTSSTGSGSIVLSTSPTLTTPILGTPTSGTLSNCTVDGTNAVGFRNIPQNSQSAAYTLVLADSGKHILHPSADTTARTYTIPANSSVSYAIGTALTFVNQNGAGVITISITSDTLRLAGSGATGNRTLTANGVATAIKVTTTEWIISGVGLT